MVEVELSKEDLCNYLFELDDIGIGSFGIVKKINDDVCVKIYYKDIYKTFVSKNINNIDDEINTRLDIQNESIKLSLLNKEMYENSITKLELLSQLGYINKVLYYKGYKIGIEMKNYQNYKSLCDAAMYLDMDGIKIIIDIIRLKLDELLTLNIFPRDLTSNNILVDINTLDVVLIDLDDICTRYDTNDYLEKNPRVRKYLLNDCNKKFSHLKQLYID